MGMLEEHLRKKTSENEEHKEIFEVWIELKREITKILENISFYFPHFSLHNATHSKTICIQIERVLGNDRIEQLSISDTWMLLMSFYCHDLGMALQYDEVYNYFKSAEYKEGLIKLSINEKGELKNIARRLLNFEEQYFSDKEKIYESSIDLYNDIIIIIENHFRKGHAERSATFIQNKISKNSQIEKIIGIRYLELLSEICRLHQEKIANIKRLPYKTNGMADDYMHPRLIAVMLCLGDLLDLDTDRYNEYMLETVTPLSKDSSLHLKKHKSVKHFLVEPDGIEIVSDTTDIKVYRIMREWVNWIDEVIEFMAIEWGELAPKNFGIAPRIKRKDLFINGSEKWVGFSELKFNITRNRASELLQGANIYKNKFACLREIIQNAVDASLIQFWKEKHNESPKVFNINMKPYNEKLKEILKYNVQGKIYVNKDNQITVEVRDYGTGISNEDLLCIKEIGNKVNYKKDEIIKIMPDWLKPSGVFGLGLQSIFLITNSFEIITKTDNELPKKIILESGSNSDGYIIVEDYNEHFKRGTKLIITIDPEKIDINDLGCSEYHYKTIPKCELIIPIIKSEFDNIKREKQLPAFKARNQNKDYVPVEIVLEDSDKPKEIVMTYSSIFNENFIELRNGSLNTYGGNILFEFYDDETMSICNIYISGPQTEGSLLGEDKYRLDKYFQSIFFKNRYVKSEAIGNKYRNDYDIYKFIDFSINVLAHNAEKMLTISRNNINKSYKREFRKDLDKCIKNTLKKLIDKLLENKYEGVQSVLIKILMIANYYEYRIEEFEDNYEDIIIKYNFNNYFDMNNREVNFSFEELRKGSIYFFIDKLNNKNWGEYTKEIVDLKEKGLERYIINLKNKNARKHILAHNIEELFVAIIDGDYFICAKSSPFCIANKKIAYKKGTIVILYDLILAIIFNHRCIKSNSKYDKIATLSLDENDERVIELPFSEEVRNYVKKIIFEGNYPEKDDFLQSIVKNEIYKKNVKFISGCNGYSEKETEEVYNKFINSITNVLFSEQNKDCIKFLVEFIKSITSESRYSLGIYDKLENNKYLIFTDCE